MADIVDFANRVMGARVVSVDEIDDYFAYVEIEHRGTDADTCRIVVAVRAVEWRDPQTGTFASEASA